MTRSAAARRLLAGSGAYLVVLGFVLWPWFRVADRAVPSSIPIAWPDDARLHIAMIDAALRPQSPGGIFRAPIFHPAPDQMLGTEILASSFPLAAPFLAAMGNATFAASGAAMLGYPLAAIAMAGLLLALGCAPMAAWTAGLMYALGPLRIPGNIQVLQYPNFWLPVVVLSIVALRSRPTVRRAGVVALVLALAGLSSMYMAVIVSVCAVVWCLFEAARRNPGRAGFVGWAGAAGAVAALPIGLLGARYAMQVGRTDPLASVEAAPEFVAALGRAAAVSLGLPFWGPVAVGIASMMPARSGSRRWAAAGGAILLLALALASGPRVYVGGFSAPGPFALLAATPLRFFRAPWRFVVLAGFGGSLLAAAGLDAASRLLGARAGALVALAVAGVVLAGARIDVQGFDAIDGQVNPVYDEVATVAGEQGAGPLLELPIDNGRDAMDGSRSRVAVGDSMVGATRHRLPLVWGFTGYPPPHEPILRRMIGDLGRPGVLAQLVDMTHVRWILLRPARDWADPGMRDRILRMEGVVPVFSRDGWDLLRVGMEPRRPEFHRALAAGPRAGRTPLGTPVDGPRSLAAGVAIEALPREVTPGDVVRLVIRVENLSGEPWPATDEAGAPGGVRVVVELRRAGDRKAETFVLGLPWDVLPGEHVRLPLDVRAPGSPGISRVTAFPWREGGPKARLRTDTRPGADEFEVVALGDPGKQGAATVVGSRAEDPGASLRAGTAGSGRR